MLILNLFINVWIILIKNLFGKNLNIVKNRLVLIVKCYKKWGIRG